MPIGTYIRRVGLRNSEIHCLVVGYRDLFSIQQHPAVPEAATVMKSGNGSSRLLELVKLQILNDTMVFSCCVVELIAQ